jgi:uncharacterized membrane protein
MYVIRIWNRENAYLNVTGELAVIITAFWNVTPFNFIEKFQRFRGTTWLSLFSG